MPGAALELHERKEIFRALVEDPQASWAALGRRVARHPTAVTGEVGRCGGVAAAGPDHRRVAPRAPRWRSEGTSSRGPWKPWRQRRRRRCGQQRNPRSAPRGPNNAARPAALNNRAEASHWEVDQIIGAYNRSLMIWLTERQSRYLIPVTMPDGYNADATLAGLVEGLDAVPAHLRRSLTFDCGSEWANWRTLAAHYDLDVWFCDPHSPSPRGGREPQPPSALVIPTGHRPAPRHPRPSPTRR